MSYQVQIIDALKDWGLTVMTVGGWQTRGSPDFDPRGHVCHHDAIVVDWTTPPGVLVTGRPDLDGPLCNFALQNDGTVWLVAAGRANHAGEGGWHGLSGNSTVWGTEANNAGTGSDSWPDVQLDAYYRLCAATCDFSGFAPSEVCGHKEWTSRKIDPIGIDMGAFRAQVARQTKELFTVGQFEKIMARLDSIEGRLKDGVPPENVAKADRDKLTDTRQDVRAIRKKLGA